MKARGMKATGAVAITVAATFALAGCSQAAPADEAAETADVAVECGADHEVNIYLARHGKTMLNTVDLSQGWIDAPLTPVGVTGAEDLGRGLADVPFDAVYSSDSGRAIETAKLVLTNNGQEALIETLVQYPELREYNFGTFEGMPNEEMAAAALAASGHGEEVLAGNFADAIEIMTAELAKMDAENVEPGTNWPAENYDDVAKRSTAALDEIAAAAAQACQTNVLVVSHGMTITTLASELGAKDLVPPGGPKNSSVTLVTYTDGDYAVESFGDTSYVEAGAE